MTGTYLRTHNHFGNSGDLQRDLPHMVSEARKAGYRTGVCGKSHVPDKIFQHFEYAQVCRDYDEYLKAKGLEEHGSTSCFRTPKSNPEFNQKFESGTSKLPYKEHEIAWMADRAIDFLTDPGAPVSGHSSCGAPSGRLILRTPLRRNSTTCTSPSKSRLTGTPTSVSSAAGSGSAR